MNYQEAVDYIEEIPKFTTKNPPEHTRELLKRLGSPQKDFKIIHVAGTNGKGSVCAYLNAMLMEGGYRCGLFTSPHLVCINERYKINNQDISDEEFLHAFLKVKTVVDAFTGEGWEHPSYFETLFLMGMLLFQEKKVQYAILETGLGGRLDATNVIEQPLACIITSISLEHTEYLGDTVAEIASEKAGIIKPGVPVIYDGHNPEAAAVIAARAKELGCRSYMLEDSMYELLTNTREGITFRFSYLEQEPQILRIPYIAAYQMMNASLAYFTMCRLEKEHGISREKLIQGIAATRWEGRMETVLPGVIVDGAHNEDGVARFVETACHFRKENKIGILFSAVSDKKHKSMIQMICEQIQPQYVVVTSVGGYRGVSTQELAEEFVSCGCENAVGEPDVESAFEKACALRGDGMLFCVGSLYLVGEIKALIRGKEYA